MRLKIRKPVVAEQRGESHDRRFADADIFAQLRRREKRDFFRMRQHVLRDALLAAPQIRKSLLNPLQ